MSSLVAGCCGGAYPGGLRGAASPETSHAATFVPDAATGATVAPRGGRRAGEALRGAGAVVAAAAADHAPRGRRVGAAAVRCGHGDGPWPPGCSWSGWRAPGSAVASDSWDTPSAGATGSLRREDELQR